MPHRLTYSPLALTDMEQARDWYEAQREGLGDEFLQELEACIRRLSQSPESFGIVKAGFRMALAKRFPYAVVYRSDEKRIDIAGVVHTSRGPEAWRERLT